MKYIIAITSEEGGQLAVYLDPAPGQEHPGQLVPDQSRVEYLDGGQFLFWCSQQGHRVTWTGKYVSMDQHTTITMIDYRRVEAINEYFGHSFNAIMPRRKFFSNVDHQVLGAWLETKLEDVQIIF